MSLKCLLKHKFIPSKIFTELLVITPPRGKPYDEDAIIWHGYICEHCSTKQIKLDKNAKKAWAEATQNAYDWMRDKTPNNPTMLKLIQK